MGISWPLLHQKASSFFQGFLAFFYEEEAGACIPSVYLAVKVSTEIIILLFNTWKEMYVI